MPRALAIRHLIVPDQTRTDYRARLVERTASARACGYNLWAFEQDGSPERIVEFLETSDASSLRTALLQDALLAESLDFRAAPEHGADGASPEWQRYVGLAGAS
jgi:hypothetical protein